MITVFNNNDNRAPLFSKSFSLFSQFMNFGFAQNKRNQLYLSNFRLNLILSAGSPITGLIEEGQNG